MSLQAQQIQLTKCLAQQSDSEDTSTEGSGPDKPTFTMPQGPMVRRVKDNEAGEEATMVNTPLGEKDLWAHIQTVEIEGNKVKKGGQMYNYRNDASGLALAREDRKAQRAEERAERERRIAEKRDQMLFEKQNGLGMYWVPPARTEAPGSTNGVQNGK